MLIHNSKLLLRQAAVSLLVLSLTAPGTISGAAFAAETKPKNNDDILQQVFALQERQATPETIEQVSKLLEEGKKFSASNEYNKAITKFQDAYALSKEIKYSDGEGRALTSMCTFYQSKAQLPRAKELGENAIEVLAESADKKSLGEARVALAQVYFSMDNAYGAVQQLDLAMKCFSDLGAKDSAEAGNVLMLAAGLGVQTGHLKEAIQFYEGAATYFGQSGNVDRQVNIHKNIAALLGQSGYLTAALEQANKALSAARSSGQIPLIAIALECVSNCQFNLCEFTDARRTYEEILQLKIPGNTALGQALVNQGYGSVLAATGDLDQAKSYFEKALATLKTEGTAFQRVQLYNSLGIIESAEGHNASALQYLKQALDLQGIVSPKQDQLAILILQNLASAEARAGERRNAKSHLLNALAEYNGKKLANPPVLGKIYAAIGEVSLGLKEFPEAEKYLRQGIEISQKANDDSALWRDYTNLARIQIAEQQPATESLLSALSFFRSPQAGSFPHPAHLTYPSGREELAQELVSLLVAAGLNEQGLLAAEQLKEELFISEWHRRSGEVKAADSEMYDDLVSQRAHLHAAEVGVSPDKLIKDWQSWLARFRHLSEENRALARLIAPVPITMSEIERVVQTNKATVIDYLVNTHSTLMFTIDSSGRLTATQLPVGKDELQAQVSALLTASGKSEDSSRLTERRLLQLLFNELLAENARKVLPPNPDQTVVIIPDSVLFNLPFAALVNEQGKYLIENHTLTLAPSMSLLLDSVPRYSGDLSVVVAANNNNAESREGNETNQISSIFEPDQVVRLIGKEAEGQHLEEQARNNAVLHFAASMPILKNNPMTSILPWSTEGAGKDKMTAGRLFGLKLPSDLAVWSATSVNARDYQGNAVQVFSRGLNYAGVRNVLMSLWIEPDPQRTSELVEFYRGRQMGLNQAQSLRKAQLLALSKDPAPRSWAAFQLIGPGN